MKTHTLSPQVPCLAGHYVGGAFPREYARALAREGVHSAQDRPDAWPQGAAAAVQAALAAFLLTPRDGAPPPLRRAYYDGVLRVSLDSSASALASALTTPPGEPRVAVRATVRVEHERACSCEVRIRRCRIFLATADRPVSATAGGRYHNRHVRLERRRVRTGPAGPHIVNRSRAGRVRRFRRFYDIKVAGLDW